MAEHIGLTSEEAARRHAAGQHNRTSSSTSRSLGDILRGNLLNIANIILISIILVLVLVGEVGDALVTGSVVFINVLVGSYQEYRSKQKLDEIALLTRPQVTVIRDGQAQDIDQADVVVGDVLRLRPGDQAVADGEMIAYPPDANPRVDIDESALTGESDHIPKRPGDDILSGSFAVVGEGYYEAQKVGDESFAQQLTAGARQFTRVVTPLQRQISIIVRGLVLLAISLAVLLGLAYSYQQEPFAQGVQDAAVIFALVPQGLLLMVTVAYALGAVRIARKGALVQQSNAVESLSNVDVLCMDKTGTLTTNRILFDALHPLNDTPEAALRDQLGAYIGSTSAQNRTAEAIAEALPAEPRAPVAEIPFSSVRKWSGASFQAAEGLRDGTYILGAPEMLLGALENIDADALRGQLNTLSGQGLRVLLFAHSTHRTQPDDLPDDREPALPPSLQALGLVSFTDELRPGVGDVLAGFRRADITLKVISGDNPDTVAALAYQAGFDPEHDKAISGADLAEMSEAEFAQAAREHNIFGRITPAQKSALVDVYRGDGRYVAMMGDGVNDVLSLKKAQVGIAMEDGSSATRGVADMVLLGNQFNILPDAFLEGQRILNGMSDSMRLFLTRTLYTALLIVVAGFIGTEFPLTPRHNALLTTLPVGIPAFFLAYWAKPGQPKRSLLASVTSFVIPAGFSMLMVTGFLWVLYVTSEDATVETGRTVLTVAGLLGGLFIIILAEHEREAFYRDLPPLEKGDPRRRRLALVMLGVFAVIMAVPGLRDAFELTTLSWADLGIIAASMSAWAVGLWLLLRYDVLERLLIPDYK